MTAGLGPVSFEARRARWSSAWHVSGWRLLVATAFRSVLQSVLSTLKASACATSKFARSFARSVRILTSLSQPMLMEREHLVEPSHRPTLRKSRFQLRGVPPRNGLTHSCTGRGSSPVCHPCTVGGQRGSANVWTVDGAAGGEAGADAVGSAARGVCDYPPYLRVGDAAEVGGSGGARLGGWGGRSRRWGAGRARP